MKKIFILLFILLFTVPLFGQDLVLPFLIVLDWIKTDSLNARAAKITSTLELDGSVAGDCDIDDSLSVDGGALKVSPTTDRVIIGDDGNNITGRIDFEAADGDLAYIAITTDDQLFLYNASGGYYLDGGVNAGHSTFSSIATNNVDGVTTAIRVDNNKSSGNLAQFINDNDGSAGDSTIIIDSEGNILPGADEGSNAGSASVKFNLVYGDTAHFSHYGGLSDFTIGGAGEDVTISADTVKGAPVFSGNFETAGEPTFNVVTVIDTIITLNVIGSDVDIDGSLTIQDSINADGSKLVYSDDNDSLYAYIIAVNTDAYNSTTWNGNNTIATKDAIRDKIESVVAGGVLITDFGDSLVNYDGDGIEVIDLDDINVLVDYNGGIEISDDSLNIKLNGSTLTLGTSGISVTNDPADRLLKISFGDSLANYSGDATTVTDNDAIDVDIDYDRGLDITSDSLGIKLDGATLTLSSSGVKVTDNTYQPLEATLTDIADGTIDENLVNTANPWADNEVADDITLTNISQITTKPITSLSATNWRLFYSADGGVPVELALGVDGTFLESNGAAAAPAFRTLVAGDIPDISATYQPLHASLTSISGLSEADVSILETTADNTYNIVTSGGNNYMLGSTSDNSSLEFKAPTGSGSPVLATSPTLTTPDIGTPSAGTLTSCTGLPISTGVSGLGTNVATFLATPSSANLASALTNETGSGAAVFGTSPTLTTSISVASGFSVDVTGTGNSYLEIIQDNNAGYLAVGRTTATEGSMISITDGGSDNLQGMLQIYNDGGVPLYWFPSTANEFRVRSSAPTDDDADGYVIIDMDNGNMGESGYVFGGLTITAASNTFNLTQGTSSLDVAAAKTVDIDQDLTVDGTGLTITGVTQANTVTLNESFTIGDGNDGTLTYSAGSKTLTVEDNATIGLDLNALEGLSSTGLVARTAANTYSERTITGTANEINVSDGDGVSDNPTLSLPDAITLGTNTGTSGGIDFVASDNDQGDVDISTDDELEFSNFSGGYQFDGQIHGNTVYPPFPLSISIDAASSQTADTSWVTENNLGATITIDSTRLRATTDDQDITILLSDRNGGNIRTIESLTASTDGVGEVYYTTDTSPQTSSVAAGDNIGYVKPSVASDDCLILIYYHYTEQKR